MVYDARKALLPAQPVPATPSRMDVSPTALDRKLTEWEEVRQVRVSMSAMGGAGTARDPPVKAALANEVDRLKKLALEYSFQGSISADDLLRFVTVGMKGYEVLQALAEELLVTAALSCCVERLLSRGMDVFRPKRRRMYQSTLEALMVLADNGDQLAVILGISEPVGIAYSREELGLILTDAAAQFEEPPGNGG
jgi:hypothetical protein